MGWKEVGDIVAKSAPMLGGLLGGPPGAAVGAVGAMIASAFGVGGTPEEVSTALTTNPDAAIRLKEIEKARQVELQALVVQSAANQLAAETASISAVNTTMQAEAKSENWPTYSWRPAIGFAVAFAVVLAVLTVAAAYIGVIFYNRAEGLQHLPGILAAIAGIIGVVSPILGIASFFRGRMQAQGAQA